MAEANGQYGLIGGAGYRMEMVKCQDACPVHTDACGYVNAIAEGSDEDAYRIAQTTNPFASFCGRVCGVPNIKNNHNNNKNKQENKHTHKQNNTNQNNPDSGD